MDDAVEDSPPAPSELHKGALTTTQTYSRHYTLMTAKLTTSITSEIFQAANLVLHQIIKFHFSTIFGCSDNKSTL